MKMGALFATAAFISMLFARNAQADTTYTFRWDDGETTWFKFATGEFIAQEISGNDSWDADVDLFENITGFVAAANFLHPTAQTISATNVKMRFVITDVSGSFDSGLEVASFTITGRVQFSASGVFSESSCKTSTFAVSFSGGYNSGTDSATFAVPALSGSGTQACSGQASTLNTLFSLGSNGSLIHFNKFQIFPA